MLNQKAITIISYRSGIFIQQSNLFSDMELEINSENVI